MQNLCKTELLFGTLLCKTKAINQQPIRYTRKPRWLPKAPTKMFRVPVRPRIAVEEKNELFQLFTNYRTTMKSIQKQLETEMETSFTGHEVLQEIANKEEALWLKCIAINDEWNTEVAMARDKRMAIECEAEREIILARLIETEELKKLKHEEIEQIIRLEKEKSKSYITADNIDEAIKKALDNVVDHNYALDLEGNICHGNSLNKQFLGKNSHRVQIGSIN